MSKIRIVIVALLIAALFVSSIAGITLYYNRLVATTDSEIADLSSRINQLQRQNNALNQQLNQQIRDYLGVSKVMINSLEWISGFNPIGGMTLENQISATVKNQGTVDVSALNLTLTVSLHWVNGDLVAGSTNYTFQIDRIEAGESKTIQGTIDYRYQNGSPTNDTMLVGQLWLGNILLDERNQTITNLPI